MPKTESGEVRFLAASDQSLLVSFEPRPQNKGRTAAPKAAPGDRNTSSRTNVISSEAHQQVRRLLRILELQPLSAVKNLHPAYSSVLVKFDPLKLRHEKLEEQLKEYIERMEHLSLPKPEIVEIPVCYGGEFGPDLNDVAALHHLPPERVIELHSSTVYTAYFLGFTPGFAYLGELPEQLQTPRLASPRRSVPAGSVGIAGSQTGVYPTSTPGGWRLLGRTPVAMFQPDRAAMSLLSIGDRVKFAPISAGKFAQTEKA
jgi:inhibitor of KinA